MLETDIVSDEIGFDELNEELERLSGDDLLTQALGEGKDLRHYGLEIEAQLRVLERECVQDYINESDKIIMVNKEVQECDTTLSAMQEVLAGFQSDLSGISQEISHLQDQSIDMSVKLKNRRAVDDVLHAFVEKIVVDPDVQDVIEEGEVNDVYVEYLIELHSKTSYLSLTSPPDDGSSAGLAPSSTEVAKNELPRLERLRRKAITKAHDFLSQQMNLLKRPKTNIQIMQQNVLLKFSFLFDFLHQNEPEIANEIRLQYSECMNKTIYNVFRAYETQLMKLEQASSSSLSGSSIHNPFMSSSSSSAVVAIAGQDDKLILEVEPPSPFALFSSSSSSSDGANSSVDHRPTTRYDIFQLGERDVVLGEIDAAPILVHVAHSEGSKYLHEVLIRSLLKHLIDAATSEYLFIYDFFKIDVKQIFDDIFGRTCVFIFECFDAYLPRSFDVIGSLLLIRVCHGLRLIMSHRRHILVLEDFFDRLAIMLWPRFKQVLNMHHQSIVNANVKKLTLPSGGAIDPKTNHYSCRRFAELLASLLHLMHAGTSSSSSSSNGLGIGGGGEDMLGHDLSKLTQAFVSGLLTKISNNYMRTNRDKAIFLILSVLQDRGIGSDDVYLNETCDHYRDKFVDEEMKESFPRLMKFVDDASAVSSNNDGNLAASGASTSTTMMMMDDGYIEDLNREFASRWRNAIESIYHDVINLFVDKRNGSNVLVKTLRQLVVYYTRYQDLVRKMVAEGGTSRQRLAQLVLHEFVQSTVILTEIRNYTQMMNV